MHTAELLAVCCSGERWSRLRTMGSIGTWIHER